MSVLQRTGGVEAVLFDATVGLYPEVDAAGVLAAAAEPVLLDAAESDDQSSAAAATRPAMERMVKAVNFMILDDYRERKVEGT